MKREARSVCVASESGTSPHYLYVPPPESLQKFVQYCQQHLKGDEKGESQNFLDRFF